MEILSDPSSSLPSKNPNTGLVCYNKTVSHGNAIWMENSLENTLPSFVLQFAIVLALNRALLVVAESAHIPRTVVNIFTGFLLGPSAMGRVHSFFENIFPYKNMMPLESIAGVFLVYYVFLVGLDVDLKPITRCYDKKAMVVAAAGTISALPIGFGLYYLFVTDMGQEPKAAWSQSEKVRHIKAAVLWGTTLSCSSEFPEIAKVLADMKLLLTETGQLALTSSLVNDLFSWTVLLAAMILSTFTSVLSLILTLVIVAAFCFVVPPLAQKIINKVGSGDREFLESQVLFLLHAVLIVGLLTDGVGAQSVTGAFFLGVVIPKGSLNDAVQEKVFDFVSAFMMPLFFVCIGLRIQIGALVVDKHWLTLVIVLVLAIIAKVVCVFVVSWIYQMPLMEGFSLALLMNTKGTLPVVVLSIGRDMLVSSLTTLIDQDLLFTNDASVFFVVMLLACWLMTAIAGPILASTTKIISRSQLPTMQHKSMQSTRPDSPLRVLACVHTKRDATSIINLLKESNPSVRAPIQVLAVELIKMSDRPISSLIIKDARKPTFSSRSSFNKGGGFGSDSLSGFDDLSQAIFSEKLRVISQYSSMHKDILHVSQRRGVSLILTTLYKQPTYDGLGAGTATARAVNIINRDHASKDEKKIVMESLVKEAPCCVALFVDRGFGEKSGKEKTIAMFYVGGADDREALSYAWRMSGNMEVALLTVVRLVWDNPEDEFDDVDREYLRKFVQRAMNTPRIRYLEKAVKDEKETVKLLNKIGKKGFDLFVVGRGHGRKMSLAQTVDPVLEEPALGPLGDALTDLNSAAETSILILQRRAVANGSGGGSTNGGGSTSGSGSSGESGKYEQNESDTDSFFDFSQSGQPPAVAFGHYF